MQKARFEIKNVNGTWFVLDRELGVQHEVNGGRAAARELQRKLKDAPSASAEELTQIALEETIGRALSDERDYFNNMNSATDYGDEWPEVARNKAQRWRHVAAIMRMWWVSQALSDSCNEFADELEQSIEVQQTIEIQHWAAEQGAK